MSDGIRDDVPSAYQLRGALIVASLIPPSGARHADLRLAYQEVPSAGAFHVLDLDAAEAALLRWGLVEGDGERLHLTDRLKELLSDDEPGACEAIAAEALAVAQPLWLSASVSDAGIANELLPDGAADRLASAFPDPERREALLLAAARIADETRRREVGGAGEDLVVECLKAELERLGRPDLADRVVRLSLRSDQLGYDVRTPTLAGGVWRIEVKASSRHPLALDFFLSRAEAETGRRLSDWALTVCQIPPSGNGTVLGWCRYEMIDPLLPRDTHDNGSWQSARIRVHPGLLEPGLPPLDE